MHLQDRLGDSSPLAKANATEDVLTTSKGKGKQTGATWEPSPELREKSLQERKAKMVLEARR